MTVKRETSSVRDMDGLQSLLDAATVADTDMKPTQATTASPSARTELTQAQRQQLMMRQRSKRRRSRDPNHIPREHRPQYSQEQEDAILYYRDSVQMPWKQVVESWNKLYDRETGEHWSHRTISGLQSRYYRLLGIPKGSMRRSSAPNPEIGLLKTSTRRYWWTYGDSPEILQTFRSYTPEELKVAAKMHTYRLRKKANYEQRHRKQSRRLAQLEQKALDAGLEQGDLVDDEADISECISSLGDEIASVSSIGDGFDRSSVADSLASNSTKNISSTYTSPGPISPTTDKPFMQPKSASDSGVNDQLRLPPIRFDKLSAHTDIVLLWRTKTIEAEGKTPSQEDFESSYTYDSPRSYNPMSLSNMILKEQLY